jgi:hypothetical protein
MLMVVEQRKYIQNFLDFVSSFLITEDATIDEINLVKANLDILNARIQSCGNRVIKGSISGQKPRTINTDLGTTEGIQPIITTSS